MDPIDAVTRRVDLRLIPLLTVLYFFSYLDRINIGNAKLLNIANDTNTNADEFDWAVSLFYVSYVTFEIPSNLFMRRFGASTWIGSIMIVWGIIMVLMILVRNSTGLLISRFFLGVAEAGFFPGVIFYLTLWYRRKDQALRVAIFFSGASLAGAFGGLLAYGVEKVSIDSPLRSWQWIFIIEGVPTVCLGMVTYKFLVDYPRDAKWLNQCHKDILLNGLREDEQLFGDVDEKFSWKKVTTLLRDWKIPVFMLINFGTLSSVFCLSTFLPTIINTMESSNVAQAQLLTVPPYIIACVASILIAWHSAHFRERGFHVLACLAIGIVGFLYLILTKDHPYIGANLAAIGVFSSYALIPSWLTCNIRGKLTRAIAIGLVAASGSVGGILSGHIYRSSEDGQKRGHIVVLSILCTTVFLVIILKCLLTYENKKILRTAEELTDSEQRSLPKTHDLYLT